MKLFIANLSYGTASDGLKNHFEQCGTVDDAQVVIDRETGRSRGFGFVEMSSDSQAREAIEKLNGSTLDGRPIVVKEAENSRPSGGGRSGGYARDRR
ncbi:MAG: RNA-binding protein [Chlamydiia bacterium]|nr:RNA-binding protein [Chlamydiia bacterium]